MSQALVPLHSAHGHIHFACLSSLVETTSTISFDGVRCKGAREVARRCHPGPSILRFYVVSLRLGYERCSILAMGLIWIITGPCSI